VQANRLVSPPFFCKLPSSSISKKQTSKREERGE
jgi:hypothetical protein